MAKNNKMDPLLPYNPKARKDRSKASSAPHKHGKRKVWNQNPGDSIRDGLRTARGVIVPKTGNEDYPPFNMETD